MTARTPMPNRIAAVESGGNAPCLRGSQCAGCGAVFCVVCERTVCGIAAKHQRCARCAWQSPSSVVREHAATLPPLADRMRISSWLSLEMLPVLVAVLLAASPARADDAGQLLAAAAVHEAGFDVTPDEIAAIHAVSVARCGGSIACQMPRFFAARTHRPWARWLRRDGTRPWGWPTEIAWSRARPVWLEVLRVADEVVAGRVSHVCEAPPQFWGMRHGVDMERARRAGLVEVRCGETRNAFWRQP